MHSDFLLEDVFALIRTTVLLVEDGLDGIPFELTGIYLPLLFVMVVVQLGFYILLLERVKEELWLCEMKPYVRCHQRELTVFVETLHLRSRSDVLTNFLLFPSDYLFLSDFFILLNDLLLGAIFTCFALLALLVWKFEWYRRLLLRLN